MAHQENNNICWQKVPNDIIDIKNGKNTSNIKIHGLKDSLIASNYPMSSEVSRATIPSSVGKLGSSRVGGGHDNFLNGIIVQFDWEITNKMWVEAERYHFLDFVSSQSTMHRIQNMDLKDMTIKYTDDRIIEIIKDLQVQYNKTKSKEDYLKLIYSIPSGLKITARMTTNFRQLKTIYYQRRNHRLPEWVDFCKWLENDLPYFKELCLE